MRTPILYNQIDLFAIIRRDSHQLQLFSPWFAFAFFFLSPLYLLTYFTPSLLVSCLAVSCSSPSWQRRYRWCSEWSSFHRSTTSVRSNHSIKVTPTRKSLFTTRYTHTMYMHVYRSSSRFISEGSFFYAHKFIPIFFLFAFYSVWPQGFKGAHADGAVGGEHYNMLLLCFHTLPLWCRHPSIVDWVVLGGGGFRCTWRSPALISSGPKRLWGEFLLRSIIFFCSFKTKFLKLSETVSFSIQISITR